MRAARLFELNEIATLVSGVSLVASYLWMKWKIPSYKLAHLRSPGPMLGLVQAYRQSPRPEREKHWITTAFQVALIVFLVSAVISFGAGFIAAVRGPEKLLQF
jgi:hypothetical protein